METLELNQSIKPAYNLLKLTFGIVPIVAGLDKFTNILTQWESYIHPEMAALLPLDPSIFMMIVGVVEIMAGLIVLMKPAIGGYIVAAWLTLISIVLILGGQYLDVAIRDLVMAIGAFSLARLARLF